MISTPQQVLTALKKKQYVPVYFFQGEEPYYIDMLTNYIEENVLNASEKAFNLTVVYGKEQTMPQILTHARRYPMGSRRQVVIVKEAQELQDLKREEGRKYLEAYIKSPQPATLLVWAYKYQTLDAKKALSKALVQHAALVHSKRIYEHQIGAWVATYAEERGVSITAKATMMLQECVGNNLVRLSHELNKLRLNLQQGAEINDAMVQAYVGVSRTFNAFELQKALIHKDFTKACKIVLYFAENPKNNPAIPLVAFLFSFFSKLLLLHHARDTSEPALAKLLQVSPYFVREYLLAARHYPLIQVIKNIQYLHQADLQLKGVEYSTMPEGQVLKELLFKLLTTRSYEYQS